MILELSRLRRPHRRLLLVLLLLATAGAFAESPIPSVPTDGVVTEAQIETAIQAIEVREGLGEETRGRVIDQLRDAQAQLQNQQGFEAGAADFAAALNSAPIETARLREQLDAPPPPAPTIDSMGLDEELSLEELEQRLAQALAELASVETQYAALENQVKSEEGRPSVVRERINELRTAREELSTVIASDPPSGENVILSDARKLAAELKLNARDSELKRLDQELVSQGVRLELLRAKRDVVALEAITLQQRADLLQTAVNNKRQSSVEEAQIYTAAAELAAADKHPVVRELAQGNAALTAELPPIADAIEIATDSVAAVNAQAEDIEQRMLRSRQQLEVGGVTQAIGRLLVEERRNLPSVSQYRSEVRSREKALATIGLAQVRLQEERRDLAAIALVVDERMAEVAETVTDPAEIESIREEVLQLLRDRRGLLEQATNTYRSYLQALGDLDVAQRRLLEAADEYRDFLDQNLLWIPSTTVIGLDTFADAVEAATWVLSPRNWADAVLAFIGSLRSYTLIAVLAFLLLGAALISRGQLRAKFKGITERVGRLSSDNIWLTFGAIGITAVHALPLPLFLAIIGWGLQHSPLSTDFTTSLSRALLVTAPFLYNLLLFRVLCARNGVARTHFGWQKDNLVIIRRQLDRLIATGTPLILVTVIAYASPEPSYRDSLGRLAFIAFMIVLAAVVRPLGNPANSVAAVYYDKRPDSWVSRLKWLWYGIEVGGPLLLALLAAAGYLYTSAILTGSFIDTIWLVLALIVANLVILRWLALARRKIAWQMAINKRQALKAEKERQKEGIEEESHDGEGEGEIPLPEPKSLDLDAVDQQSRRLLQAGLFFLGVIGAWAIWSEVLPALTVLDQVSLWTQTRTIDGVESLVPVTLADLLLAFVIAAVTWVAAKNLPGLMEIAVLQRLDLQPGSRYTINTLLRYAVITIGIVSILSVIGWNWSRIQWLVAALSVGLGFGLQEIVANFVSGLIILFERPVRVGDTVTVGNLSGTVTRVRIRATTITDWDRKEIIVPNKSFITEQVINWTLSDPITRVVIQVGISYGSDVKLAHRVMEEALREQPLILDDPPPRAYFMGFGDSSLDFKLYMYSRQLGDRFPIMHAVHEDILQALRDNDIEIPFPQRDLHLRSVADEIPGMGSNPGPEPGKP
ncbi:MAG: mechanosensitive ion channel [Woeseiaceae bacterium]|nr:mechanosensitive ion channel [Woeseiaceae bacterium]